MASAEQIVLTDVQGFARKSGTDVNGCQWIEFEVAYLAGEPDSDVGECSICGASLARGWFCMDGGEEVCGSHVVIEE